MTKAPPRAGPRLEIQTELRTRFWASPHPFPEGTVLLDSSHGSACAVLETDSARKQCANRDQYLSRAGVARAVDTETLTTAHTLAERGDQLRHRRDWIERAGEVSARLPVWSSRDSWLDGLRSWATSRALASLCAAERVSITAATLLAVAAVMADYADHGTGRHVAVTRATIAERLNCHKNTVSNAWAVLRASGWAVEAQRGHGSPATPSVGCRASVYHLVPRRQAPSGPAAPQPAELRGIEPLTSLTDSHTAPVENCDLPPSGGVCSLAPVGSNSPSAHPREKASSPRSKSRRWRAEPRPAALQRLADALTGNEYGRRGLCRGLRHGHIGAICDALTSVGIDPAVWSAKDIQKALEADMRRTGGTWPDQITNPGGFLASRLRKLGSFTGRTPASATAPPPATAATAAPAALAHIDKRGPTAHQAGADIQRILDAAKRKRSTAVVP
ncbi:Putative replication protein RepA [Mycobacteroides abscessus subsp. abscessus]|nr:Putative replication protein RepA [Mycobacteroides abscessus subsp. abscessus]SLE80254.1 Putative replication protein RepA [Mycobacteroides abscessus subsp. abscessus]